MFCVQTACSNFHESTLQALHRLKEKNCEKANGVFPKWKRNSVSEFGNLINH